MLLQIIASISGMCLAVLGKPFSPGDANADPLYPYDAKSGTIKLPEQIEKELRRLVATGNKIEAVRRVLQLTGAGLKNSKDYVDSLERAQRKGR